MEGGFVLDLETLRKVQLVQLEILRDFHKICMDNHIPYQLYAGTLLGTVRHKGFIPWDDDVDVCMLRRDYDRFLEVCEKDLDHKYFIQNYNSDRNYPHQFSKMKKNKTTYIEKWYADLDIHHGIFIDVFPLDNVRTDTFLGKLHIRLMNFMWKINTSRFKSRNLQHSRGINRIVRMLIYYILKLIPKNSMDRMVTRLATIYNKKETKWVGDMTLPINMEMVNSFLLDREDFYDTIDGEFEGYRFPIPRDYHEVLTRNYGDYMTPPPIDKQEPHHDIIAVDFGLDEA